MLSYQHAYHVGAPADCLKHALLCAAFAYLQRKPAPIHVWDVHAGRALYPIDAPETQKLKEYEQGLAHLWPWPKDAPESLGPWHQALAAHNPPDKLTTIPGSSGCLATLARPKTDILYFTERHPGEFAHLAQAQRHLGTPSAHQKDGFAHLRHHLSPTSRNLVLLDPSYETPDDFNNVFNAISGLAARAPKSQVHLWYPLLADGREKSMLNNILNINWPGTWHTQALFAKPSRAYLGTGHMVLGLPFNQLEDTRQTVEYIADKLTLTLALNTLAVPHR